VERSLVFVKPDAVKRGLIGEVISRFEKKGFKIIGIKMIQFTKELSDKHYEEHINKPFYPNLLKYILLGPVVVFVVEGKDCVQIIRQMMGATKPTDALPGTIRGDFANDVTQNIIHGSDSIERAKKEIKLFFKDNELFV